MIAHARYIAVSNKESCRQWRWDTNAGEIEKLYSFAEWRRAVET